MKQHFISGFSLLEILIALAIISGVMLAVIQYQTVHLTQIYQTYLKTQAIIQIESMLERLRANSSTSTRLREYNEWNSENLNLLPQGHGNYSCENKTQYCTVQVTWNAKGPQAAAISALVY